MPEHDLFKGKEHMFFENHYYFYGIKAFPYNLSFSFILILFHSFQLLLSEKEVYAEPKHTSKMELTAKIFTAKVVNGQKPLTILQ